MPISRYVLPLAIALSALAISASVSPELNRVAGVRAEAPVVLTPTPVDFAAKAGEARRFASDKNFNESICFLIDMSIPSNRKRFFIYDLKNDEVKASALVSHGMCYGGEPGSRFSNTVGSGCSSLGKYKIGKSYCGQWGYSYKLHGLEKTNNNAYERTVVLHSHNSVPDIEVEDEIVQSLGCPMVSPTFLQDLKKIINSSEKPVLLWIYQ